MLPGLPISPESSSVCSALMCTIAVGENLFFIHRKADATVWVLWCKVLPQARCGVPIRPAAAGLLLHGHESMRPAGGEWEGPSRGHSEAVLWCKAERP